jgi:DNA-binding NarL/FixJ family response regulator
VELNLILLGFQTLFSEGIKEILNKKSFIKTQISQEKLSEIAESKKTIEKVDIILLKNDASNPFLGSEISAIKKTNPNIKIIAIGENYETELHHALNQNVDAFLQTSINSKTLFEAIDQTKNDQFYIEPSSYNYYINLLSKNNHSNNNSIKKNHLTKRELQILQLICHEKTTKEISNELCISCRTVDNHRKNLLQKTNSKSTIGLVLFALKNKLFSTDSMELKM